MLARWRDVRLGCLQYWIVPYSRYTEDFFVIYSPCRVFRFHSIGNQQSYLLARVRIFGFLLPSRFEQWIFLLLSSESLVFSYSRVCVMQESSTRKQLKAVDSKTWVECGLQQYHQSGSWYHDEIGMIRMWLVSLSQQNNASSIMGIISPLWIVSRFFRTASHEYDALHPYARVYAHVFSIMKFVCNHPTNSIRYYFRACRKWLRRLGY